MVDPQLVPFNPWPPPVVIEEVTIEGTLQLAHGVPPPAEPASFVSPLPLRDKKATEITARDRVLRIPPGKQRFRISLYRVELHGSGKGAF
jgi:hypothetical protein